MGNDRIWEILLDAIEQNRVVPIIGDEFFYAEVDNTLVNYKQYILNSLISKFNPPKELTPDFNLIADLIKVNNQMQSLMGAFSNGTNIYYEIGDIVRNKPIICDQCLSNFLSSFNFPLIITTSYIPGIENIFENKNCTIKAYDKTPRIDLSNSNIHNTTLYYLFGKCSKANKSYMVTEDDLLDYMHYWHNIETRPHNLSEYISDKFLLLLGCNYPNWLFRFFWHSIKNFNLLSGNDSVKGIVASSTLNSDNELSRFLSRIQTHTYSNGKAFLNELINKKRSNQESSNTIANLNEPESPYDIFISYSHVDYNVAAKIAETFEKFGAKVWFDCTELIGSDLYDQIINEKISECIRFVPILSATTEREKKGYFRKEWSLALDELRFRLGSPYIAPIAIDEINYSSSFLPKEFKETHILNFNAENFENEIKRLIRSFR